MVLLCCVERLMRQRARMAPRRAPLRPAISTLARRPDKADCILDHRSPKSSVVGHCLTKVRQATRSSPVTVNVATVWERTQPPAGSMLARIPASTGTKAVL